MAGPTTDTSAGPPGLLFSHELEEVKRKLSLHEQIPAHLLDPEVLTARLARVEESVREILEQAQAPQTGATSCTVGG